MPPLVDRPRVLLLWPGGLFAGGANFGVPQLLCIAGALQAAGAVVDVVDLDMERAFGPVDLRRIAAPGYDLIGVSCYSSYDYLKVMAIGAALRAALPGAWLTTGGYHPSARPHDFLGPESPFDFVVVGDGEAPLVRLLEALVRGKRPLERVRGPESLADPNALASYDWELLARYQPIARRMASQAEIYLSRGCPYDCAFCMERAKRDVSWRAIEPGRAVEEVHRLDRVLDLSRFTLFIADALFGMKASWRKAFLEELARRPCRARKVWLLIRVDLIDREDLQLMQRANVSPGFGLESGDPAHLKRIRKAGKLDSYLDKMLDIAATARELGVPFGCNVIVGHPGETEASMRTSAAYLRRLFLDDARGTTGFLSVDPFRLYPGSPIDEERAAWERDTGMRVHRYPWWHDGDQDFLSEWVDPSDTLDFRTALRLRRELFDPIVRGVASAFRYDGPAQDYFRRAIDEQVDLTSERRLMHTLGMWQLWNALREAEATEATDESEMSEGATASEHEHEREHEHEHEHEREQERDADALPFALRPSARARLADDGELASTARALRLGAALRIGASEPLRRALANVARERFVPLDLIGQSADDCPLALTEDGGSTISALHAYVAAFEALALGPGDALVDLGGGTGYGAALAAEIVGATGRVVSIELEPTLALWARMELARYPQVHALHADAHDTARWCGALKVYVAFALPELPSSFADALGAGGELVAPIGPANGVQVLTLFAKSPSGMVVTALSRVRYVPDRHAADASTVSALAASD